MKSINYLKRILTTAVLLGSVFFVVGGSLADEIDDIRQRITNKKAKWKADITSMHKLDEKQRKMRASLIMPTGVIAPTTTASSTGMLSAPSGAFDWRDHGGTNYVTPIRDQGNCGSCWAFASTAALESYTLMNGMYDINRNLSEQILVSCSSAGSCSGGYLDSAASFIESTGLPAESYYPYTATNGSCSAADANWRNATNKIVDWQWITRGSADVAALKDAVYTYGPIVVSMAVYFDFFSYRSGIYSHTGGSLAGYHAVTVVGYADDSSVAGGGYFIVKNSWGNGWGEGFGNDQGGYFRIEYDEAISPVGFGEWAIAYIPTVNTCYYGFNPSSSPADAGATSSSVGITTGAATCIWHVRSNVPWLTVSNADGKGPVQISYSVAANSSSTSRTGTISLYDTNDSLAATFTVIQEGQPSPSPVINSFVVPTLSNSLTIPILSFTASGPKAITGYQITTTSTKPTTGWLSAAPTSVTVTGQGRVTLYAWVKDSAGNISAPATATVNVDTIKPVVSTFTVGATSASMTVSILTFTATDSNSGVAGYLVTDTSATPTPATSGWSTTAPASYTVKSSGANTLYAWAKDAAGNVSVAKTAIVNVTVDTTPPTVTAFTVPALSNTLTVAITTFTASDNVGVTGKLVTEVSTKPLASALGWTTTPASYTFTTPGTKTLYAWAKDAADNVSATKSATVTVTIVNPVTGVASLPKTGQTTCYDEDGVNIPCLGTGQDGETLTGVAWPNPRFADNGDQTISDRLTGLVWTKDAYPAAKLMSWQQALNYIKSLNSSNYLGHNDWRMPNRNELVSLTNEGMLALDLLTKSHWLSKQGFLNVQPDYWSSSSRVDSPYNAMMISVVDGATYGMLKTLDWYVSVWPVRTGQPAGSVKLPRTGQTNCYDERGAVINCSGTGQDGDLQTGVTWPDMRFTGNSDQTMTDNLTGLSWTKDANPAAATQTWQQALDYIQNLNNSNYLGHNDWRLPNRNELASLVNTGQADSASWLNSQGFSNVQTDFYWSSSSTVYPQDTYDAYIIKFYAGFISSFRKKFAYYVWPVRGGQAVTPLPAVNGSCGSANNSTFTVAPATNLCATGTASIVSGTGPWSWSCNGGNGGGTASCSAKIVDTVKPMVTAFTLSTQTGLTVPVSTFTATDNVAVTGYLVTQNATVPAVSAAWQPAPPANYLFAAGTVSGKKTLYAWAMDAAGNVSAPLVASVTLDATKPVVTAFTVAKPAGLTITFTRLTATDNIAVAGYLVTESATVPAIGAAWRTTAPANYSFATGTLSGAKTLYAWAMDAAGNVSTPRTVTATVDIDKPVITAFTTIVQSRVLTVPVTLFTASDNMGITGYLVTENAAPPAITAVWKTVAPTKYVFAAGTASGVKTLYAWVRDAAGNVSEPAGATVTVDTVKPVVSTFTVSQSKEYTVPVANFTASDNIGVIGYLITEKATVPAINAAWQTKAPTSYVFASGTASGKKTLYAWVLDAAGNVSAALRAAATVDMVSPVVSSFTVAKPVGLTIPITRLAATDNIGVTGYLVTESASAPAIGASWQPAASKSYLFAPGTAGGVKTLYAWARDAAGNVSSARSTTVTVK